MPLRRALSNGANHNSGAAYICKLLVVLVAPTQREQSIGAIVSSYLLFISLESNILFYIHTTFEILYNIHHQVLCVII